MSIATDITGGSAGGANQLMEMLSLISDPKQYEARLKALQDATEVHRKHISLVGPADEIVRLRDEAAAKKKQADEYAAKVKQEADDALAAAKVEAKGLVADAKAAADKLTQEAKKAQAEVNSQLEAAKAATADAEKLQKQAATKLKSLEAEKVELLRVKAAVDEERVGFQSLKDELIAKHKAFIEGL